MPLGGKGEVKTLIGRGLFVFGDKDGPARVELLEVLLVARPEALPKLLAELRRTPPPYPGWPEVSEPAA